MSIPNNSFNWSNESIKDYDIYSCHGSAITKIIENSTYDYGNLINSDKSSNPEPNIALLSVIYVVCTCCMALVLKVLRRSNFFSSYVISFKLNQI